MRWSAPLLLLAGCVDAPLLSKPVDNDPDVADTDAGAVLDQPDIELSTTTLAFEGVARACPTARTLSIGNVGTRPLQLQQLVVEGTAETAFSWTGPDPMPARLRAGEWLELTVTFGAAADATDTRLVVRSDDPDEARVAVDLSGRIADASIHEESLTQPEPKAVDLLWVIDYSPSMNSELDALADEFTSFMADFIDLDLDWRMAVTGAYRDCGTANGPVLDTSTPDPVAAFVDQTLGAWQRRDVCTGASEQGLGGTSAFLGSNPDFPRTDANLAVVVASDELDQSVMDVGVFSRWLAGLKGGDMSRVSFSGLVGPPIGNPFGNACPPGSPAEADAFPAPIYHLTIQSTGGVWGSLCSFDFAPFLRHLAYTAAGFWVRVELDQVPVDPSAIVVTRGDGTPVVAGKPNGWTYLPKDNAIVLHGDAVVPPGGSILLSYEAVTVCE